MRRNSAHRFTVPMLFLICMVMGSCTRLQEPDLKDAGITGFEINGLTSVNIRFTLTVDNPNRKSLSAEALSGSIYADGTELATFELSGDPLVAPPSSTSTIESGITVSITDPLALISAGISLKNPDLSRLTADAEARIRIGDAVRRIHIRQYSLKELARHLNL